MIEPALEGLVEALRLLPGVGVKSAQRMAFHQLQHNRDGAERLADALHRAVQNIHHCERCHTFTDAAVCSTCLDPRRDPALLCVVETPADQAALERSGSFKGLYFVLMGRISPLDGVGASDIGVARLLERAADGVVQEVILATPCFLAVDSSDRMTAKSSAPSTDRKPPEIFWRNFIIRPSRSARLLVNGTVGSVRKRNTSGFRPWSRRRRL